MTESSTDLSLVPDKRTWLRSAVAAIPWAGGALDHLLFDRADEIRLKNLESSINALIDRIKSLGEDQIDEAWFSTPEALAMFRSMSEKVQFEPDGKKIESIAKITAVSGSKQFANDKRKLSVLEHVAQLSYVQIKLLRIISTVAPEQRELTGGVIKQNVAGLWENAIREAVQNNPDGQFWDGTMDLSLELDILCSFNALDRTNLIVASPERCFLFTRLGHLASQYAAKAEV